MKGTKLVVFILATSIVGYASSAGIIEAVVKTLFTDCTVVKTFLGATFGQVNNSTSKPSAANITVYVYGKNASIKTGMPLKDSGNVLWNNFSGFNTSLPTEIVIHGFAQFSTSPGLIVVMDSLIKKGGSNVLLIDASVYIGWWYLYSSTSSRFIGEYLGQELATLVNNGYDKSKIHLIGFSLGAVIAGFAGSYFRNITGKSLPWITGLDPAGPCFFNSGAAERLDTTDADFVDIIHTNMGIYGTTMQMGHVDFYPNSGDKQPGTITPFFSHAFVLHIYAESVRNASAFPSAECKDWLSFIIGGCFLNPRTNMGYGVSKTATGKYYLSTKGASPYNKGEAGIPNSFFSWIFS